MIENRELTMDDYMAMLRRRAKIILVPAALAPLAAFAVSFAFAPKYTSQSVVLWEGQKVPATVVQPVVTEDLITRMDTLWQQSLGQSRLQPVIERLYPNKSSQEQLEMVDEIRQTAQIVPVPDISQLGSTTTRRPNAPPTPGFNISYTSSSPRTAQQICTELTNLVVDANLKLIQDAAKGTSDVLNRGLEDARRNLDDLDAKLATFKKQYVGQLPDEEENNLKILMGLSAQLDAVTQALNRAQQEKAYGQSMLSQQLAAWRSSQSSTNPQTLEKELSDLQAQLLQLEARYTDDHPDVIKAKADIAEVKKKLAEINKASADDTDTANDKASAMEPPDIRQLRLSVHQNDEAITAYSRQQKQLQQQINVYQSRVSVSPAIEGQYKQLTRDYDVARKGYDDLLAKKNAADLTVNMNNQSEGERMFPLSPANLPDEPSFPNRLLFAGGGLGAGLALGFGLALWLEIRDQAIRTEADAEAALELPILVSVPWVGNDVEEHKFGKMWQKNKKPDVPKETTIA
jgi:polysaccharide chain length determinant protein (PEP-CTERM system associated)